ncbi:MAG TPA: helix-turn-helix transcriptional regulator [Candidatus Saccharimonadia bacterium]|nr:helix-turn-helix transcriptional regulator [Candidatus Saccharimonadia bacterium]
MDEETRKSGAVLDLLDAVYQAPFDARWWPRVGELLVPLFEADCAVLASHDHRHRVVDVAFAHGIGHEMVEAYTDHYARIDPWPAAAPATGIARRGGFYHDFWRSHGDLIHTIGGVAPVDDHVIGNIGLPRERRRGPYRASALALLDRVSPHIHRSLRLSRQLARAGFTDAVQRATPATQSLAAWLVDDTGRVVFANPRGEQLLRVGDGLSIRRGTLVATLASEQPAFAAALAAVLRLPYGPSDTGPELTIKRPRDRASIRLSINPAPVRMLGWLGMRARGAFIVGHIPEPPGGLSAKEVQRVLALTQAEARVVAALASGHDPRVIAERFNVSLETVRAQVKSAMRRLDCHRQSQLIGKVLEALGRSHQR